MRIPMTLTVMRIFLIPVFVILFYLPFVWSSIATAAIFSLAAITDWLDGFLARKLQQTSAFGAFLDPVADKLMVVIALVLLVGTHKTSYITLPALVIVGREITVSSLREWMAEIGKSSSVAVSYVGKVKTVLQFIAIVLLLAAKELDYGGILLITGYVSLFAAALLTLWSMMFYLKASWSSFNFD